jgi:predicted GH43/DUF377 family glycosyl hydrolase
MALTANIQKIRTHRIRARRKSSKTLSWLNNPTYSAGQARFAADDPAKLIARLEKPFFKPQLPFDRTGQYAAGTPFIEGLVFFKGRRFLYSGCADSLAGVAIYALTGCGKTQNTAKLLTP